MKLWTKEIEERAKRFPIGSQDSKGKDATVLVKYFNPYGAGTWIITEAEKQGDDWLLFGYCNIFEWEWGYVLLSEIESVKVKVFGDVELPLERDMYLDSDATVNDCL